MAKIAAVKKDKGKQIAQFKVFFCRYSDINLETTGFSETKSLAGIFDFDGNKQKEMGSQTSLTLISWIFSTDATGRSAPSLKEEVGH